LNYFGIDAIEKQIEDRHSKFKTRYSSSENVLCQSIFKIALYVYGHILLFTLPVCLVKLISSHYYYHYYFVVFHATIPMVTKDTYN